MSIGDKFTIKQGTTPMKNITIEIAECGLWIDNDHISTTELLMIIEKRNNREV